MNYERYGEYLKRIGWRTLSPAATVGVKLEGPVYAVTSGSETAGENTSEGFRMAFSNFGNGESRYVQVAHAIGEGDPLHMRLMLPEEVGRLQKKVSIGALAVGHINDSLFFAVEVRSDEARSVFVNGH